MTYAELIEYYGSELKAAVEIGMTQGSVNNWKRTGIPRITQFAIQAITKNKLKVDEDLK